MAILNKTYPLLWVSEEPQSIRAICVEYADKNYDRLSKHVVCRGFESHFRATGIAQGLE